MRGKKDMATRRRIIEPHLTYHVFSRCVQNQNLMNTNNLKDKFAEIVEKARKKYNFTCTIASILPNHFHLIIYTQKEGGEISRIMQYIKSQFARFYNKQYDRTGPFWNERYGDKIVEFQENPQEYYINLLKYIGNNAVKKKLTKNPFDYEHCSYGTLFNVPTKIHILVSIHPYFIVTTHDLQ
jgi:putative transposase